MKAIRVSRVTYFSNLSLVNTVKYSEAISAEINKVPVSLAFFNAIPGIEFSLNNALIKVLVSNTQNSVLII